MTYSSDEHRGAWTRLQRISPFFLFKSTVSYTSWEGTYSTDDCSVLSYLGSKPIENFSAHKYRVELSEATFSLHVKRSTATWCVVLTAAEEGRVPGHSVFGRRASIYASQKPSCYTSGTNVSSDHIADFAF